MSGRGLMVTRSRRRRGVSSILACLVVVAATLVLVSAAVAETTTTAAPTATTVAPTATTAAGGTVSTAGPVAVDAPGVTPAPSSWQPLNPGVTLTETLVQLWPEYDTTSQEVLVLVDLTVPDSVPLPVTFTFAVPKGARVTGFAQVTPNGSYDYNRPNPEFSTGGADYDLTTVTAPAYRQLHFEYYYTPPGMAESGEKSFPLVFINPAETATLTMAVQQPKRSSNFALAPAGETSPPGQDGYTYASVAFPGMNDGDRARVDVSYTKDDTDPSEAPGDTATPGASQSTRWFLVFLVVLIVAVAGIVIYRLFFQKRDGGGGRGRGTGSGKAGNAKQGRGGTGASSGGQSASASRKRAGAGSESAPPPGAQSRFCTQCGTKLSKKDRFCPECGAERED